MNRKLTELLDKLEYEQVCGKKERETLDSSCFVAERENAFEEEILIKDRKEFIRRYPDCVVDPVSLEDIILFYVRGRLL